MISTFDKKYFFLSNFYACNVTYDGITYKNAEAAFQAQKTTNIITRKTFEKLTPSLAKAKGRRLNLRNDWEDIKDDEMRKICKAKFTQNKNLLVKLIQTWPEDLQEGNTWGDTYWGVDITTGYGKNKLGQILESIRLDLIFEIFFMNENNIGSFCEDKICIQDFSKKSILDKLNEKGIYKNE